MKVVKIDPIEIGREEAFEICKGELPTACKEHIISRNMLEGSQIVYKEDRRFYIATLEVK